jgi:hypothetical protein
MMNRNAWVLLGINTAIIIWLSLTFNSLDFPSVGVDYRYFLTRLVDTDLFYRVNGLVVQWYTPSFNGGLPSFPHPQQMQFSLIQALVHFFEPWTAVQINYGVFLLASMLGSFYFLNQTLLLDWKASLLGSIVFIGNGFYLQHMSEGHLNHQGFILLPLFLMGLFNRRTTPIMGGMLISISGAVLIYSGSFYPIIYIVLSMLILIPTIVFFRPEIVHPDRVWKTLSLGLLFLLGLSAAKLNAVYSFMRFFPRIAFDLGTAPISTAIPGVIYQLLGVMFFGPIFLIIGKDVSAVGSLLRTAIGTHAGIWELDISITPICWLLLIVGLILSIKYRKDTRKLKSASSRLTFLFMMIGYWIVIEFSIAQGFLYPLLKDLPVISSFHVYPRFTSALIFPIALLGALSYHEISSRISNRTMQGLLFGSINLLAIIPLFAYLILPINKLQERIFDQSFLVRTYRMIRQGEVFPIESITSDVNESKSFLLQTSTLSSIDMIFGYAGGKFKANIEDGPVLKVSDGYFNMTDPTSLVYPEVNGSSLWSRISVSETEQMNDFINRRQPNWNLPTIQKIANAIAIITLLISVVYLIIFTLRRMIHNRSENR